MASDTLTVQGPLSGGSQASANQTRQPCCPVRARSPGPMASMVTGQVSLEHWPLPP